MSGGGLGGILKMAAPLALSALVPGFGSALAGPLMSAGLGESTAGLVSSGLMNGLLSGGLGALTGSKNPLQDALLGGATGAAGNYFGGIGGSQTPLDSINGAAGNDVTVQLPSASGGNGFDTPVNAGGGISSNLPDLNTSNLSMLGGQGAAPAASAAAADSPSFLSKATDYIGNHPLQSVLLGTSGLAALQGLMPQKKLNTPNSGFSDALPDYHMQTTNTPYTGDWYTYGQSPQAPQVQNQVVKGPAQPYAKGGPVNPLAFASDGQVPERGNGGHADNVPAMLSEGEFVVPAEVVSALGDGSSKAGGKKLESMVSNVRKHKATKSFPPKAKNPLSYIGASA